MSAEFDALFQRYGAEYGVDWRLLKAQVVAESNFDPYAISDAGAQGLAQFMPATFKEWAAKLGIESPDAFNPEHAIHAQAAYMSHLINQFGDQTKALAAYNYGMGHLAKIAGDEDWFTQVPIETRRYIASILRTLRQWIA